jgi:glycine cleavage system H protein
MNYPEDLRYARTDEWVRLEGETATVGISDYAQHELGDIVYVELPEVGSNVSSGVAFGVVESVKAVSELLSPVSGTVVESNQPVADDPSLINGSPYEDGWLIKVRVEGDPSGGLMEAAAYSEYRSD